MPPHMRGLSSQAQAWRALEEVERLVRDSAAAGVRLDPWIRELAEELRAVLPCIDADGAALVAERMARQPRASLLAQGRVRPETLRSIGG